MNKDERKRLEKLQEDSEKGKLGGGYLNAPEITTFDLHLLLSEDETTQKLIRDICKDALKKALKKTGAAEPAHVDEDGTPNQDGVGDGQDADDAEADLSAALAMADDELAQVRHNLATEQVQRKAAQTQSVALEKEVRKLQAQLQEDRRELERKLKLVPPSAPPDALRAQLAPELALLKAVQADADLAQAWLHTDSVGTENEARQLVRLLAVLGDWDELQALWTRLADRCKQGRRAAAPTELAVLNTALALHNLRYRDRAATLVQTEVGNPFHHETMERGTPKGSTVQAVWLPGLRNAAGQLQKHTLVQTGA